MYKQYFKQALRQIKENKLLSFVSIFGTAFAIAMIMAMVIVQRIEVDNFSPEANRNRTLYVKWMTTYWNGDQSWSSNGPMSILTAKECFKKLTTPEAVCVFSPVYVSYLAVGDTGELATVDLLQADDAFWKVFEFSFISGRPFDESDFNAALRKAVICESLARKLYDTTDVVGRTISLNYTDYTVTGVVKDVSKLASTAYAQVWIPYSTTNITQVTWATTMGMMRVAILAHSADDFQSIREEAETLRLQFNDQFEKQDVMYRGQPDTQFIYNNRKGANKSPDITRLKWTYAVTIILLLLVPAINISGLTLSRMRKRYPELGLRRSFGATRREILYQILTESMMLTLIGGVIGLILSYLSVYVMGDFLFGSYENSFGGGVFSIPLWELMDPFLFVASLLFCLILNLMSAGVPAWKASRINIVEALNS